jgi:colanic acid biosynthesis glycosyl transferase WcaI
LKALIISGYYYPETVGAGVWVRQLATGLAHAGHTVTLLTSFPSYPAGVVFPKYRGKLYRREIIDGLAVVRTATYATPSKAFWPRIAAFGSFCASAILGAACARLRADVVYAILPPLPLGLSAAVIARFAGAPLVVNIQDIYPDIAVDLGYLRNPRAIAFFRRIEKWIYSKSARIVVISDGFRRNLLEKGVPESHISVVSNWADPGAICPGTQNNSFRRELGVRDEFLVLYSGGLTHNSDLSPILKAARELIDEPFRFAIVGDGVQKESLQRTAADLALSNVQFLPFQPIERYPEVLAAADATLVALHSKATFASVPSKIYKQMAAGRAVVAITNGPNELTRLIQEAACGYCVQPDDDAALLEILRGCIEHRDHVAELGANGRAYLERECNLDLCVQKIERILLHASGQSGALSSQAVA